MQAGASVPAPTDAWARAPSGDGDALIGVLGLRVVREGVLWMLDGQSETQTGRFDGWNTRTELLHAIHSIGAPVARPVTRLNDLAVDREKKAIYITARTVNAIGVTKSDDSYDVLFQSDEDLPWPDGFPMGVDGFVYATVNELHRSPVLGRVAFKLKHAAFKVAFEPKARGSDFESYSTQHAITAATMPRWALTGL